MLGVDRLMKGSIGRHVLLALLASGILALAAAQGIGTLPAGQTLLQVSMHAAQISSQPKLRL